MIVVDSSALVAILDGEPDAAEFAEAVADSTAPLLSAAALVETGIVMLRRHGPPGWRKVNALVHDAGIRVEGVTAYQAKLAVEAFAAYGKGVPGGADLNFGDCFSYALAKATDSPLLFKGDDFSRTDLKAALPRP